jgi:hypothetical protein
MAMTAQLPSHSTGPLNPLLYSLLERKFGSVSIANLGEPAVVRRMTDPVHPGRTITHSTQWGEYYTVCCPFCDDSNFKLWINHTYGADIDEERGRRQDTYLAICYRHNCIKRPGVRAQLEHMIFGDGRRFLKAAPVLAAPAEMVSTAIEPPGTIELFDSLPEDHPAALYLHDRGFDPLALSRDFGVGVCTMVTNDKYRIMRGRVYMPVTVNNKLVMFQGRKVGQVSKNDIKYYTAGKKSLALYNHDRAVHQPLVVVVEGVPSVWRLGAPAVALFGKTLSHWQCTTIATTWVGKPVFLMLDHDADVEGYVASGVEQLCRYGANVVPVLLPDARDPADYTRPELHEMLTSAADAVGVSADLSFLL